MTDKLQENRQLLYRFLSIHKNDITDWRFVSLEIAPRSIFWNQLIAN